MPDQPEQERPLVPTYEFEGTKYTQAILAEMSVDALLGLRNQVAQELNLNILKSFVDQSKAIPITLKVLEQYAKTDGGKLPIETKRKKPVAEPREKKPRLPAKCAAPMYIKRPTIEMFSKITKLVQDAVIGKRPARWNNYKDGMTLIEIMETDGTDHLDVGFYVKEGLMSLTPATQEEFEAARSAWYAKNGRVDPEGEKAAKAEERAKANEQRKAEAAAKKAEKEAAKAEKARVEAEAKAAAQSVA